MWNQKAEQNAFWYPFNLHLKFQQSINPWRNNLWEGSKIIFICMFFKSFEISFIHLFMHLFRLWVMSIIIFHPWKETVELLILTPFHFYFYFSLDKSLRNNKTRIFFYLPIKYETPEHAIRFPGRSSLAMGRRHWMLSVVSQWSCSTLYLPWRCVCATREHCWECESKKQVWWKLPQVDRI